SPLIYREPPKTLGSWAIAPCRRPTADPLCGAYAASGCARGQLPPLLVCRSRPCLQVPPLWDATPASGAGLPCGLALAVAGCPLAGGLGRGQAVDGRPFMGDGCGWPPLLLAAFAAKMQQERVEQFYMIQSQHTQFKTNLSYKNLGSDTTIGKLQ
ncbi:hypothetical protein BHE74_00057817, partial [Ensete ventricosum]